MAGKDDDLNGTAGNGTRAGEGDDADNGESQFYVGTYKNREEAERGFREKEAYIAKLRSEHDKAVSQVEKLQNEFLGKLTNAVADGGRAKGHDADTVAEKKKEIERLREELREHPDSAVDLFNAWLVESETTLTAKMQERFEAQMREIEQLKSQMLTTSPEYQQNKAIVESLTKRGVPMAQAVEIAKEFAPMIQGGARSDVSAPLGTTGSASASGREQEKAGMTESELEILSRLVPGGLRDDERKRLKRRG